MTVRDLMLMSRSDVWFSIVYEDIEYEFVDDEGDEAERCVDIGFEGVADYTDDEFSDRMKAFMNLMNLVEVIRLETDGDANLIVQTNLLDLIKNSLDEIKNNPFFKVQSAEDVLIGFVSPTLRDKRVKFLEELTKILKGSDSD